MHVSVPSESGARIHTRTTNAVGTVVALDATPGPRPAAQRFAPRRRRPWSVLVPLTVVSTMLGLLFGAAEVATVETTVVVVTADSSLRTAIVAVKAGAVDYLSKPYEIDELRFVVAKTLETARLQAENRRLVEEDADERVRMIERVCTHETRFFREPYQFELLEKRLAARRISVEVTDAAGKALRCAGAPVRPGSSASATRPSLPSAAAESP